MSCQRPLIDAFDRRITYLRLSVTDRCDLRCAYCMPERMQFLPKNEVLSLEELYRLSLAFIERSRRLPGSWASTGNALEGTAFALKDCLFVVDDFALPRCKAQDAVR